MKSIRFFCRLWLICTCLFFISQAQGQSKKYDIALSDLPQEVKTVLETYIHILKNSADLESCAKEFVKIAGGGLVDERGKTLRETVMPYSLKKDFTNIKFYASPLQISRVNCNPMPVTSGFGESAIQGKIYKIWLDKAPGEVGYPAPISIMVPEGHPEINTPKVVGIGSL